MDLEAYTSIERLKSLAEKNNIKIPRLRGYRLMSKEEPIKEDFTYSEAEDRQFSTFNKYVGRKDVLMVHARVGGDNWEFFDCHKTVATQPWFIEKVDDCFDNTYCDIYCKLSQEGDC